MTDPATRPDLRNIRAVLAWAERSAAPGSALSVQVEMATRELSDLLAAAPAAEPVPPDLDDEHWLRGYAEGRRQGIATVEPVPLTLAQVEKVLRDWGIDDPVNQSLHGWRCTYPDRYPEPCGHFDQLMAEFAALASPDKGRTSMTPVGPASRPGPVP